MNAVAPDPVSLIGNYELTGDGKSRYRQIALTARIRVGENRDFFVSYVHSRARGDINDFSGYLGSVSGAHNPAGQQRRSLHRSAQPFSGLGLDQTARWIPHFAHNGVPQRVPVFHL